MNIYPQEVETICCCTRRSPTPRSSGVPDGDLGEQVKAVVQPAAGAEPGPDLEDELLEVLP